MRETLHIAQVAIFLEEQHLEGGGGGRWKGVLKRNYCMVLLVPLLLGRGDTWGVPVLHPPPPPHPPIYLNEGEEILGGGGREIERKVEGSVQEELLHGSFGSSTSWTRGHLGGACVGPSH